LIGIEGQFISKVAEVRSALSESVYGNVRERETVIKAELEREEARFLETLERGEKLLESILKKKKARFRESMPLPFMIPMASPGTHSRNR
jgi:alanyl-tRNA synthetase